MFINKLAVAFVAGTSILALSGCAALHTESMKESIVIGKDVGQDPVKVALINSANSISESLNKLAMLEQAKSTGSNVKTKRIQVEVNDPQLKIPVTLHSSRPTDAENLARRLTSYIDYEFVVFGNRGSSPILITPKFNQTPLIDAYTQIGVWADYRADIVVDEYNRIIEFKYNN